MKKKEDPETGKKNKEGDFPGYPIYPASEDIYNKAKEETEIDPEEPSKTKLPVEETHKLNEKNFKQYVPGEDLDVPGVEMNDDLEEPGSEDDDKEQ